MATIELDSVCKSYDNDTRAVADLSLSVADGELLILVGPSGCGKSTALRMIAGLEDITSGEIRIDGELVNDIVSHDREVAMVFQNYALYPHMTIRDNMGFALKLARVSKTEMKARVEATAAMLGLTDMLARKPAQLSGGERQRAAMGRAIVREPKAFLMDEPLSNLDAKLRVQMRVSISELQRRIGTTTIYVTHDQVEAMTLGDRVAVLCDGRLQQIGSPTELYSTPANVFVAGFLGSPPMNLFAGRVDGDDVQSAIGRLELAGPLRAAVRAARGLSGGGVTVGIRPEHLQDASIAPADVRAVRVRARVAVVERLGAENLVHVAIDDGITVRLVARFHPDSSVAPGDLVEVLVDSSRIQLFGGPDQRNLLAP